MSSLSLIPLPDLRQENENLHRAIHQLTQELAKAREELRQERSKSASIGAGVMELRTVLKPLYQGLVHIFGEIEAMPFDAPRSQSSPVWESWKQKLGGQTAEAIDVLALHGEMNAEQLRIHLRCARTHVYNVISRLNKAGIINKNGGRISLKQL